MVAMLVKHGNDMLMKNVEILQIEDFLRTFSRRYYTISTAARTQIAAFGRRNAESAKSVGQVRSE